MTKFFLIFFINYQIQLIIGENQGAKSSTSSSLDRQIVSLGYITRDLGMGRPIPSQFTNLQKKKNSVFKLYMYGVCRISCIIFFNTIARPNQINLRAWAHFEDNNGGSTLLCHTCVRIVLNRPFNMCLWAPISSVPTRTCGCCSPPTRSHASRHYFFGNAT